MNQREAKLAIDGGSKTRTRPWPKAGRRFGREELKQLQEALDQNTLFYHYGNKTKTLCSMMAKLCKVRHAVACSSGSSAIHGAIKACGVGPGDEVITSPITDAGTILGIVYEGAIPVFADVDEHSWNITAKTIAARLTRRTKAVIAVHLQGNPTDIQAIARLCRSKKIPLIEDCAQAWGARVNGRSVGTFGDIGCFSLNDFKHIGCGDGGIIVTNSQNYYERAWLSIDKCYDRLNKRRAMPFCAPNYRITELQSAVAIAQLGKLKAIAEKRNRLGRRLAAGLAGIEGVYAPRVVKGGYPTWWFHLIGIDRKVLRVDAPTLAKAIAAEGVPMNPGYIAPVHIGYEYLRKHTAFNHSKWPFSAARPIPSYGPGTCPVAERVAQDCLNFALNQWLSEREIDDCVKAVAKVVAHFRAR
jgi:dTDP-4-amino-4,6-dideoxygalactose transaminase